MNFVLLSRPSVPGWYVEYGRSPIELSEDVTDGHGVVTAPVGTFFYNKEPSTGEWYRWDNFTEDDNFRNFSTVNWNDRWLFGPLPFRQPLIEPKGLVGAEHRVRLVSYLINTESCFKTIIVNVGHANDEELMVMNVHHEMTTEELDDVYCRLFSKRGASLDDLRALAHNKGTNFYTTPLAKIYRTYTIRRDYAELRNKTEGNDE